MGKEDEFKAHFYEKTLQATEQNAWFSPESIAHAIGTWGEALKEERLKQWLSAYPLKNTTPKTVAIIMAGNIPLVGFHDFLSVLITGNRALVKLSSNDKILLAALAEYLYQQGPDFEEAIEFTDGPLKSYDAVIATGSDNTARYFDYYFGNKPHIIRRNRNAAAVLRGDETTGDLHALGADIFTYFGLGCRNVSKLFVPEGYRFDPFFEAIAAYSQVLNHRKYGNNYDYNKAVYLMSGFPFLDNGFLLLKEDRAYASPIGVLFFEPYKDATDLESQLNEEAEKIQCVVGWNPGGEEIPFGKTQQPNMWDYADGVDTVHFLLKT